MRYPTMAAALLFGLLSNPALAQSPTDHEAHHPDASQAPAATPSTPPASQSGGMMGGGMMGGGSMMGQGMMKQGMMGGQKMMPSPMFRVIFALMDADGDGTISLAEFQAAHERIFKAMDSNKDGRLTEDEMRAFIRGSMQ